MYRQTVDSPIAELAKQILDGIPLEPITERITKEHPTLGKLTLRPWSKILHPQVALMITTNFFKSAYDIGEYDPQSDQIIMPQKNGCGTDALNQHIANHLAHKAGQDVFEIICGVSQRYFSVGDLVRFEGKVAQILRIDPSNSYSGIRPQKQSPTLDYWGNDPSAVCEHTPDTIDKFLATAVVHENGGEDTASHVVTIRMMGSGEEIQLENSSEVNSLTFSYALTVEESQDSKWDKVFLILHQSHNAMLKRAFLYSAVTRAMKQLFIICEPDSFDRGIRNH